MARAKKQKENGEKTQMATAAVTPDPVSSAIQEIGTLAQVAGTAMPGKQAEISKVTTDVQLGVAALPLIANLLQQFGSLFQGFAGLFHHAHAVATAAAPPAANTNTGNSGGVQVTL